MNILMMTNTYLPHVGGVARSVASFTEELRAMGHRVVVVAPEFEGMPTGEEDVVRIPAIQKFNGSDFSVVLPVPGLLAYSLEDFEPDLVHAHHPFLIGSTAVRVATQKRIPLIFTYHTHYEQYTHYVPGDSPRMKDFAIQLARGYCNLCNHVIAPSASVERVLRQREVTSPITCIPTGIDVGRFAQGDGTAARQQLGIPEGAFVVGHVGRLAPEKNLGFLARAIAAFLRDRPEAHCLVVGKGPSAQEMAGIFEAAGLGARLHQPGALVNRELIDAYHAMDCFAFASHSETQGMVVAEAMAAGLPVVALDASGVREVVRDGENGRLLMREDAGAFAGALEALAAMPPESFERQRQGARATAEYFSLRRCAERLLAVYHATCLEDMMEREPHLGFWEGALEQIRVEWDLMMNIAEAATELIAEEEEES